jgi:hypothetical protein
MGCVGTRAFIMKWNFRETGDAGEYFEETGRYVAGNGRNIYVPCVKEGQKVGGGPARERSWSLRMWLNSGEKVVMTPHFYVNDRQLYCSGMSIIYILSRLDNLYISLSLIGR